MLLWKTFLKLTPRQKRGSVAELGYGRMALARTGVALPEKSIRPNHMGWPRGTTGGRG